MANWPTPRSPPSPLDKARDGAATSNQLNLFLYLILPNAALRNQALVGRSSGDVAFPPLALNLYYLLSAYGRDNDVQVPFSQLLLGRAMSTLHDHPLLGAQELRLALAGNDLADQPERVKVTLHPLSIEEISKVWAGFQMQYRLSVAYDVSVILIDSARSARSGPPVLSRGPDGKGVAAGSSAVPPVPTIVRSLPNRPIAPGETWRAVGINLAAGTALVRVASPRLDQAVDLPAQIAADGSVSAVVPVAGGLPAGPCLASVVVTVGGQATASNDVAILLAPQITSDLPLSVPLSGDVLTVTLGCTPAVLPAQRACLVLGDREILANPHPAAASALTFTAPQVKAGRYLARLRIDGVDSAVVLDPDAAVPAFDPAKIIEATA